MTVYAKLWSRVATVDLALPEANGNYSDDRGRQTMEYRIKFIVTRLNFPK